jgi:hypothetical protein
MLRRIALFTLTALLTLLTAGAQQQSSPEPPKQQAVASEASQALTFGQSLRKTIAFLTADVRKDGAIWKISGTCFFVRYEDKRLRGNQAFSYLVTNRHMALPGVEKGEKVQSDSQRKLSQIA